MTGFFTIGDYFFDMLIKSSSDCCLGCLNVCCSPCLKLFEMVRSDAMAFIFLTGNPYCNAARCCEYMCDQSQFMESQGVSRTYRLSAHILIAGINAILALYLKGEVSPMTLLIVICLSIFISTFCISVHADSSDSLLIAFLHNE